MGLGEHRQELDHVRSMQGHPQSHPDCHPDRREPTCGRQGATDGARHLGTVDAGDEEAIERMKAEGRRRIESRSRQVLVLPPEPGLRAKLEEPDPEESPVFGVDHGARDSEGSASAGVHQACGALYRELGLGAMISPDRHRASSQVLHHTAMARLAKPGSKLNHASTLHGELSFPMPLEKIHRMMDHPVPRPIGRLKSLAAQRSLGSLQGDPGRSVHLVFFDCTTLHFESFTPHGLREQGCSKDHRPQETRELLALIVTPEGLPVTYELLPGISFEGHSLVRVVERFRKSFPVRRACVVADRGTMRASNLRMLERAGLDWIVGARPCNQHEDVQAKWLEPEDRGSVNRGGMLDLNDGDGHRLIVGHSPKRAKKRRHDRERVLKRLQRRLEGPGTRFVASPAERPCLGKKGSMKWSVRQDKVERARKKDGWHGVVTSLRDVPGEAVLERCRRLRQVETALRACKSELQLRPLFHWTESRIHTHPSPSRS